MLARNILIWVPFISIMLLYKNCACYYSIIVTYDAIKSASLCFKGTGKVKGLNLWLANI